MKPPFTSDEFFAVFAAYNTAVWPLQLLLVGLAVAVVGVAIRPRSWSHRVASGVLAMLWIWMGLVYQLGFFRAINPAAGLFAVLFVLEGVLFGVIGVMRGRLEVHVRRTVPGFVGAGLIGYALIGYPLLASLFGHVFPASPTFGLPCPTTIFTLGILLWLQPPAPLPLLVIPFAWSLIGTSAALQLGVREDLGLVLAGVLTIVLRFLPATAGRAGSGARRARSGPVAPARIRPDL